MSGNWAWEQADIIAKDPETHGSMFVPIILRSDKTMVSVATGQNPLYALIGNVQNHVRRAHRNVVSLVGFLAVPKNYLEQVLLSCIVSGWCPNALQEVFKSEPRVLWDEYGIINYSFLAPWLAYSFCYPFMVHFLQADIYELLSPDLLYQVIKGFKQWMGDDSKALMKLDEDTLHQIDVAVARFHQEQEIFKETGHSLSHYCFLIQQFGAPNGPCSSITESKHIKFMKEPWCCSSSNELMGETLLINQHLDKLAATHFLYDQFHPDAEVSLPLMQNDGMHHELICLGHYDCVYIEGDTKSDSFSGLLIAHVNLFFSFIFRDKVYPCALVQWFSMYIDSLVEPDLDVRGQCACSVIHIDTILHSAHLIGVAGSQKLYTPQFTLCIPVIQCE
ncbi:hypothetical protein EI94DRAFT_1774043 [Lactarius quietus]|nr:hypothetical protein EI94DRAFT_1774043 [Lactarius quietus]